MATTIRKFDEFTRDILDGIIDLEDGIFKLALLDSSYTFDSTDSELLDVIPTPGAAPEITGTGYTTGGKALTTLTLTQIAGTTVWDADDVTWATLTATFRGALLYQVSTLADGKTNPLVAYILFDDTPGDIIITAVDFTNIWSTNGILSLG